jgi:uncharacterized protein
VSEAQVAAPPKPPVRPRRRRNNGQRLTRQLHSWLSMISLLVVLFFALTGLTLNHQEWTFGITPTTTTSTGELPATAISDGQPNFLVISEYLRSSQGASGQITDYGTDGDTGRIAYTGPGYTASVTFSVSAGTFSMQTTRYGLIAIANDLHKGRGTSTAWGWTIDAAAVFLSVVAITGLILQLLIQKKRTTAVVLLVIGAAGVIGLMFLA